ncbi:MAG: aminoacyl-tRNA hydrolase [Desulforudis sp.]|jgi:PTH1 family peptidyl-tRNA hydrolase|nr:aminoacyl-tRNA hydrolase [Clostridia bacterium]MDQ7791864.1 aminoacyl-tRNA hydrolase [Clostridia bacterium]RJX22101.1 MAG: aminoacyl-tRNA hydrolase [Desulforudis sp.]
MRLIIGLGNPGEVYRNTRHNIGFLTVDRLASRLGISVKKRQCFSLTGDAHVDGNKLILAKPQTFMNLSGRAALALTEYYKVPPEEFLVVCDDMDLPFGRLRLRARGGSGGHRGLNSIIGLLGSSGFPRLRVGIGRGPEVVSYVLGHFGSDEESLVNEVLDAAADAVLMARSEGLERAMNRYNALTIG